MMASSLQDVKLMLDLTRCDSGDVEIYRFEIVMRLGPDYRSGQFPSPFIPEKHRWRDGENP
jgi:hypothetical protein